jgi:hypothetical protein
MVIRFFYFIYLFEAFFILIHGPLWDFGQGYMDRGLGLGLSQAQDFIVGTWARRKTLALGYAL